MAFPDPSDWSDMRLQDLPDNFLDDIHWDSAEIDQYFRDQEEKFNSHQSMEEHTYSPIANGVYHQETDYAHPETETPEGVLQPEHAGEATTGERLFVSPTRSDFAEFDPNPLPQPVFLPQPLDEGLYFDPVEDADLVAGATPSEETTPQSTTTSPNVQKVKKGGKHAHIPLDQDEDAKSYVYGDHTPTAQAARAFLDQGRKFKHEGKTDDQQACRQKVHHYTKRLFESLTLLWDGPREDFEDFQAEHYEKGQRNALIDINNRFCTVQECDWAKAQLIIVVNDLIELHEKGGVPERLFWNSEKFNKLAPEAELICSERLELLISATKKNKLIGLALLNNDGVEDIILAPAASLKRRLDNAKTNAKRQEKIGYANEHMGKQDEESALTPGSQTTSRPKAQPKSKAPRQKKRRSPDASEQEEPLPREPPKKKRRGPQKSSRSVANDQGSAAGDHGGMSPLPMGSNAYTQYVPQPLASGFSNAPVIPDPASAFHPQETIPQPHPHHNIAQQQPLLQAQQNEPHQSPQYYPQSSSQIEESHPPGQEQYHTQAAPSSFTDQQSYGSDPTHRASYDGGSPMTRLGRSAPEIDFGQAHDLNEQYVAPQGSQLEQMLRALSHQQVQGGYQPSRQDNPQADFQQPFDGSAMNAHSSGGRQDHRGSWAYEQAAMGSNAPDVYGAQQGDAAPLWQGL